MSLPLFIDASVSATYGIVPYGLFGCEVIRGSSQAAKFNEFQPGRDLSEQDAKYANWRAAVLWAGQNPPRQE